MHIVQKNVPLQKAIRSTPPSRRKYPFEDMDIGDMFFVPQKDKNTLATHASMVGKKLGRKFVTRLTYMRDSKPGWEPCEASDKGATIGIGVWRTE